MRVTTVGFVEFPSKFSSEISPSKATLHQKIFSNLRNGQSALELFWAKLFIKLDFPRCKIVRDFQIVFATHVAVRFKFYHFVKNATTTTSTPVETSKRNLDSPDKANPPWKKSKAVRVRSPIGRTPLKEVPPLMRSKKSVAFENAVNTSSALLLQESEMLSHMNVKDLPNDVWKSCSWIRLETRLWEFPEIPPKKNIGEERCYQTMERSNECALMHEGIKPELYKGTSKLVSLEFDEYLKPPPG